jgi:hypothetical protein
VSYLFGAGQIIVGIGLLIAWWFALIFVDRRSHGKRMTNIGFVVTPSLFLIWFTAGCVLIVRGSLGF